MKYPPVSLLLGLLVASASFAQSGGRDGDGSVKVDGELKQWHKVTLSMLQG